MRYTASGVPVAIQRIPSLTEHVVPDHRVEREVQRDWRSKVSRQAIEQGQNDRTNHDLQKSRIAGAEGMQHSEESGTQNDLEVSFVR